MLAPPPEPPRPGLSPPAGDIASEPLPPLPGIPTFEPGSDEITTPELSPFPPAPSGGARTEPASPGPPRPEPVLPEPERPEPEPAGGGGGITLPAKSAPLPDPPEFPEPDVEPWLYLSLSPMEAEGLRLLRRGTRPELFQRPSLALPCRSLPSNFRPGAEAE